MLFCIIIIIIRLFIFKWEDSFESYFENALRSGSGLFESCLFECYLSGFIEKEKKAKKIMATSRTNHSYLCWVVVLVLLFAGQSAHAVDSTQPRLTTETTATKTTTTKTTTTRYTIGVAALDPGLLPLAKEQVTFYLTLAAQNLQGNQACQNLLATSVDDEIYGPIEVACEQCIVSRGSNGTLGSKACDAAIGDLFAFIQDVRKACRPGVEEYGGDKRRDAAVAPQQKEELYGHQDDQQQRPLQDEEERKRRSGEGCTEDEQFCVPDGNLEHFCGEVGAGCPITCGFCTTTKTSTTKTTTTTSVTSTTQSSTTQTSTTTTNTTTFTSTTTFTDTLQARMEELAKEMDASEFNVVAAIVLLASRCDAESTLYEVVRDVSPELHMCKVYMGMLDAIFDACDPRSTETREYYEEGGYNEGGFYEGGFYEGGYIGGYEETYYEFDSSHIINEYYRRCPSEYDFSGICGAQPTCPVAIRLLYRGFWRHFADFCTVENAEIEGKGNFLAAIFRPFGDAIFESCEVNDDDDYLPSDCGNEICFTGPGIFRNVETEPSSCLLLDESSSCSHAIEATRNEWNCQKIDGLYSHCNISACSQAFQDALQCHAGTDSFQCFSSSTTSFTSSTTSSETTSTTTTSESTTTTTKTTTATKTTVTSTTSTTWSSTSTVTTLAPRQRLNEIIAILNNTQNLTQGEAEEVLDEVGAAATIFFEGEFNELPPEEREKVLDDINEISQELSETLENGTSIDIETEQVYIAIHRYDKDQPFTSQKNSLRIKVPRATAFEGFDEERDTVGLVITIYNDTDSIIPNSTIGTLFTIGSSIVSVKLGKNTITGTPFNDGLEIEFEAPLAENVDGEPQCSFYVPLDPERSIYEPSWHGTWRTEGCRVKEVRETHVTCACNHLTSFAVLMDTSGDLDSTTEEDAKAIEIISFYGAIISCFFLLLIILSYTFFPAVCTIGKKILLGLCITLMASMLLFVIGQADVDTDTCRGMAISLHFSLLSAFCWMLCEGHHLYELFVVVFYTTRRVFKYLAFSIIVPALAVGVTIASDIDHYGTRDGLCWLEGDAIWAFAGPALFVAAINVLIFIRVMVAILSVAGKFEAKLKRAFKGSVSFFVLMGIMWVPSQLQYVHSTTAQYLFAITVALSGVWLFLLHCYWDEDLRGAISRRFSSGSSLNSLDMKKSGARATRSTNATSTNEYSTGSFIDPPDRQPRPTDWIGNQGVGSGSIVLPPLPSQPLADMTGPLESRTSSVPMESYPDQRTSYQSHEGQQRASVYTTSSGRVSSPFPQAGPIPAWDIAAMDSPQQDGEDSLANMPVHHGANDDFTAM